MSILSFTLSFSLMLTMLYQSQQLHEATVCRQEAWRSGAILLTQNLLHAPKSHDQIINLPCSMRVKKSRDLVSWRRGKSLKSHSFQLSLKGKM